MPLTAAKSPVVYHAPSRLGGHGGALSPKTRHRLTLLCFLGPGLVLLAVFVVWPMVCALGMSFTDASGFGTPNFVGLSNYTAAFTDPDILRSLLNTVEYAVMFMPIAVALALGLALLMNSPRLPFRGVFRTALFFPFIVSMAVAAFAWQYLIDPNVGLLTYWLGRIGIHIGNVLQNPDLAMPMVVLVAVWKSFGFYLIIFLAGLQTIPSMLYEAARIDGAGVWQRFRFVTLPQLSNTTAFVVIVATIAALQAFDQIFVLTGGGPYQSTETIVMQIYQSGFKNLDLGFASALSYILLVATLLLSLLQFRFFSRKEQDL